jgi:hypothetical protein
MSRLHRYALTAASLTLSLVAAANPRPLPYSYQVETLPKGSLELEQFVDLTPIKAYNVAGQESWVLRTALTTEFELGLTDRLELGLYFFASDNPGGGTGTGNFPLQFDGIAQRLRWRLDDPGEWPVDVALYLEVAELTTEIEVEAKVILAKRLGPVLLVANIWFEREFYYDGRAEWVANPTAGVSWEINHNVRIGAEYWMHAEFGGPANAAGVQPFNQQAQQYLGPVVMLEFGRLWWTTGFYARLNDWDRPVQVGDLYGKFWVRTVIGIGL